jgi:hypothetical protein
MNMQTSVQDQVAGPIAAGRDGSGWGQDDEKATALLT